MFINSGFVVAWLWITYATSTHYPQKELVVVLGVWVLYNFHPQIINKLERYMHKISYHQSLRSKLINLSTQSTGPIRANLNNLEGLIV